MRFTKELIDIENKLYLYYDNASQKYCSMFLDIRHKYKSIDDLARYIKMINSLYLDLELVIKLDALQMPLPEEKIRALGNDEINKLNDYLRRS